MQDLSMDTGTPPHEDEIILRKVRDSDRDGIIALFNHYATTSFAAYPEIPVNERFFDFLQEGNLGFYVLEHKNRVAGFGFIKPVLPFLAFMKTGMVTYFLLPECTGKGLGKILLEKLTSDASDRGMTSLVANMASRNIPSIRFHQENGFKEVGRLQTAGRKFNEPFDVIWMQKMI